MDLSIKQIFISAEERINEPFDPCTGNTDVIILLNNNKKYAASFFSFKNIEVQVAENKRLSNSALNGKYLCFSNMVLIECCTRELIINVVEEMIDEGEFLRVFQKL